MEALVLEPSLYTVKAIFIMDNDGERILAKYYDNTYPSVKEQKAFEKNIFNKTHRTDSEIALLEGLTVVYKSNIDLYFYVIGSSHENELMLVAVLNCLFDSLSQMLRKNVEKRTLLDNMEAVFLAIDEIVDEGVILESDPQPVVQRVALRADDVPLTEQTVAQVSLETKGVSAFTPVASLPLLSPALSSDTLDLPPRPRPISKSPLSAGNAQSYPGPELPNYGQGDSGGPLQCFNYWDQRFYLVGVSSFGVQCGLARKVGVYTRMSKYGDWIDKVKAVNGGGACSPLPCILLALALTATRC
ncbi:coatomer subunit zeta-1-like [Carcharodon carcharias]|uniref:coatomer subunit zeta-1-like n=1 Tax=Carcharodon carcharias TaxID=13397 RepID=UPI001B7F728E|nr:coatomer subunit zeta-1-like [Carcharodon carcharias]